MRVLIVNGFSDNPEGKRSFQTFRSSIVEAFLHQKMHNVSDIEFREVDRWSIDSYLYDVSSGYQSRDSEKLFDHLDFVFIDGDSNMLPWLVRSKKFTTLIRMCKLTKKCLFACTFAMQAFVYLCATNFHIEKVVNGKGRGGSLKEFAKHVPTNLVPGDVFLDSVTGDVYCWDVHKQEIYPAANTGIHNHKDAQDNELKNMLKVNQYRANIFDKPDQIVVGKSNEVKCRIYKQFIQHWLAKDLGLTEFLVPRANKWDVHPINATTKENVYTVLAESHRGPQIIIHNNAVGVQFHINSKYPATKTVLRNYVMHMMNRLQMEKDRLDLPLTTANRFLFSQNYVNGRNDNQAKHSGFAFSLRKGEPLTVKVNATRSTAIKLPVMSPRRLESEASSASSDGSFSVKKKGEPVKRVGFVTKQSTMFQNEKEKEEGLIQPLQVEYLGMLGNEFIDNLPVAWKSKKEIRGLLHPNYPIHLMPKKGHLLNGKNLALSKCDFDFYEKPLVKVLVSPTPYCRFNKEFRHTKSAAGTIRNDGFPYIDPSKRERQELMNRKQKWTADKDFQTVVRQKTDRNVGYNAPGTPVQFHKFREEKHNNWLAGPFKTASY